MDQNIKVVFNKLENIKLNQGHIDLNNSSIQNKNDLIDICNIFRDPRYETFRIFYMKDYKIIAQEAITSRIPNGVFIFNEKTGDPIRSYEKMINRMERLGADGYYLAHNHPSGSAKASKEDLEVTKNFAANVEGFLGHIIIGDSNRYSIIEEDKQGRILMPKEQILSNSSLENIEEKLVDNEFYNIKISSRDELIALFMKMQNSKEYSTVVMTDSQNKIRMVLDIPNKMLNQSVENLNGFFKNQGRNLGATKVFIGTHDVKTYCKAVEHLRFGTFKDTVYIDDNNRIISPKLKNTPDLFDKEKRQKSHKNRDAR